ncbi:MAG: addB [Rickettsiales bacterium]|nr:addB [Rickettsiales bacterium]
MNIFTLPSHLPFIETLAKGILTRYGHDPLALSSVQILLPHRRAVRSLHAAFRDLSVGTSLLLPRMEALGDRSEEEMGFDSGNTISIPPALSSLEQELVLASLIRQWQKSSNGVFITSEQALVLARALSTLLRDFDTADISLERLKNLVPSRYAIHWEEVLHFLSILTEHWPKILAERGRISLTQHRSHLIHAQADFWERHPPSHPIIAAGTTGSIPATRRLLQVIRTLPQGEIILAGLDQQLDTASWEALTPTHPEYLHKILLATLDVPRESVAIWKGYEAQKATPRSQMISEMLRPASTSDRWHEAAPWDATAIDGLHRIDAASEEEEAATIAMILRDVLEVPDKTAMLVTPDRVLATRVQQHLARWNTTCDDSAGMPLITTSPGRFLVLVAEMLASNIAPVPFLSVFKHPLSLAGLPATQSQDYAREIERIALRGTYLEPGFNGIRNQLWREEHQHLKTWIDHLDTLTAPIFHLAEGGAIPLSHLLHAHILCAEALASTTLWEGDEGQAVSDYCKTLLEHANSFGTITLLEYPAFLSSLLQNQIYRVPHGHHARLTLRSPQEARLERADVIILASLNEGVWPALPKSNPWMNRAMREACGLPPEDITIGQSARDFSQSFHAKNVYLTRALKSDGSPTTPARWLVRFEALLHAQGKSLAPSSYKTWATLLDKPDAVTPCAPPAPTPPLPARPRELGVTAIETLMRDPYSLYASKILRLRKLDPLSSEPDGADFGTFIHRSFHRFLIEIIPGRSEEVDLVSLHKTARAILGELFGHALAAEMERLWWPRFERIATWFIHNERTRRKAYPHTQSEVEGFYRWESAGGMFTLTARADRIDSTPDGTLAIIDYKTGTPPLEKEIVEGHACQLALEALIAERGGFSNIPDSTKPEALAHWHITGRTEPATIFPVKHDITTLINSAETGVKSLIDAFDDPATPYRAIPNPKKAPRYNDYAHLARVKEWQAEETEN